MEVNIRFITLYDIITQWLWLSQSLSAYFSRASYKLPRKSDIVDSTTDSLYQGHLESLTKEILTPHGKQSFYFGYMGHLPIFAKR